MLSDAVVAVSFFLSGVSANYCWRMLKRRTRYIVSYREYIRETPEELYRMIKRLRTENQLLRGRIETLEGRGVSRRPIAAGNVTPTTTPIVHRKKPPKK
ncbi:hypothetical protein J2S73_004239 [Amorphus orientalis]|uniref:Uncharacterized protein n=1 Tax=Amorphus orientalis TaxID=649198 RepID=A0AAE3VT63_9HYPH|nr:hypothetical protein [Amorphus orientalis]